MPEVNESSDRCQQNYKDLAEATLPDSRSVLPLRRLWWTLKKYIWYTSILGPIYALPRIIHSTILERTIFGWKRKTNFSNPSGPLRLKPGEWVRVKTAKEIFATLDADGKLRGLGIMHEMMAFCGKRFRVFKVLDKIIVESTGELRKIKTPTVLLEGVLCDGTAHGGCDKSCFCFWREDWLERMAPQLQP
jgi:hypothetical protein